MKEKILELIRRDGPMPLDRYMELCLSHYYATRDPFGVAGDFTTAPEINQIFGELVGIWCVAAWKAIGAPAHFALVELGPGRGTLMKDILRVAKFAQPPEIHFVETSPALREAQRRTVGDKATWHLSHLDLPKIPMIVIANEFFDALPIQQFVLRDGTWFERRVSQDFTLIDVELPSFVFAFPTLGDGIHEMPLTSAQIAEDLGRRILEFGGAGLVIDYGHLKSGVGDTLQALKGHKPCGILDFPGESDLTAHVDFEILGKAFNCALPPMTQGQFLKAMGFDARLAQLAPKADANFISGAKRLVDDTKMGALFKVLCVAQRERQAIYPFEGA